MGTTEMTETCLGLCKYTVKNDVLNPTSHIKMKLETDAFDCLLLELSKFCPGLDHIVTSLNKDVKEFRPKRI